jgi:hypothetical protein
MLNNIETGHCYLTNTGEVLQIEEKYLTALDDYYTVLIRHSNVKTIQADKDWFEKNEITDLELIS